jgi:CheY-like chemotaxis protein
MQARSLVIVEDDELLASALSMQVEMLGYSVVASVKSADEAVRIVLSRTPDVIIMDVNLGPGGSGLDAASSIRQQLRVPIIFYTAYGDQAFRARVSLLENVQVLQKPVPEAALQAALIALV